jgi:hypothetical protein
MQPETQQQFTDISDDDLEALLEDVVRLIPDFLTPDGTFDQAPALWMSVLARLAAVRRERKG